MKSKKNKIIIIMCFAVLLIATGYAILFTELNIKGSSSLTDSWGIRITGITSSATGRAYNITEPTYTDTNMTFEVGVKEPGDKMTFTVTVENYGTLDAILDEIKASSTGSESIIYSISDIQQGTRLKAGATKTFTVSTEFDINATELPSSLLKELIIDLVYIQDDGQVLTPSDPSIEG